jgi:hypothetical protein
MNGGECKSCKFFDHVDPDVSGFGECHRFPPQMVIVEREHDAVGPTGHETNCPQDGGWPLLQPFDWCGEFVRKKKKTRRGK